MSGHICAKFCPSSARYGPSSPNNWAISDELGQRWPRPRHNLCTCLQPHLRIASGAPLVGPIPPERSWIAQPVRNRASRPILTWWSPRHGLGVLLPDRAEGPSPKCLLVLRSPSRSGQWHPPGARCGDVVTSKTSALRSRHESPSFELITRSQSVSCRGLCGPRLSHAASSASLNTFPPES